MLQKFFSDALVYVCSIGALITLLIFQHFFRYELTLSTVFVMKLLVISPIIEEYIFRGVVQQWLLGRISKKYFLLSVANILTSILFAALHLFYQSPLQVVGVFISSLVFGVMFERYNLIAATAFHIFYNTLFLLIFTFG